MNWICGAVFATRSPQPAPAKGSLLDAIINLLADIFRRK